MSLTISNGDLLSVKKIFQVTNQANAMNLLHYRILNVSGTAPAVNVGLAAAANAVYTHFAAAWAATASDQVSLQIVSINSVFPLPRSVAWNYVPSVAETGTRSSQALPAQNSPTVIKRTNYGDRGGIGRVFLVGGAEDAQQDGSIVSTARATYDTYAGKFGQVISVSGSGWGFDMEPVLLKGPEDNPVRIARVVGTAMASYRFRCQRRRQPGKGI